MRKLVRNLIAWLQGFWPMWQMKLKITMHGEAKIYDASEGLDWWLPRMKKRCTEWNEQAGNFKSDPTQENYAYYEGPLMGKDGKLFVKGITSWPIAAIHWEPIGKLETDYLREKLQELAREAEDLWQWMNGK